VIVTQQQPAWTDASTWALDLDGVVWTGHDPIAGSAEAVARLKALGRHVVFVTNNSWSSMSEQEAKLASFGIDASGSVISSAMAAASLVEADEAVFVLGGPGVDEAVNARGGHVLDVSNASSADTVVVGLDWALSYERLIAAVQAILGGARFVATNTDRTYPTERGLFPGAGAIVAAVQTATGREPIVAGKPEEPAAELVRARYGASGVMVGDRPETDGDFAVALGYGFALVMSGVTGPSNLPVTPTPVVVGDDLMSLVSLLASAP
jgi:HAD superfamily hydrolase (TIGR01450 family)